VGGRGGVLWKKRTPRGGLKELRGGKTSVSKGAKKSVFFRAGGLCYVFQGFPRFGRGKKQNREHASFGHGTQKKPTLGGEKK